MGGGKSSASSSQVQVPEEVLARYNSVNTRAEQAASTPFQSYSSDPNAFVAPLTGTQQSGIANTNNAAGMAQPFFTRGAQLTQAGAGSADPNAITGREIGQYFSPFMNSVFASQLAGQEQQNAQQRSGLQGEAIKSGAFGGDRAGIAAGNLAYQQNLANSQSNAQLLNSGFGTALSTAQQQQGVDLSARQADLARQLGAGAQIAQIGSGAQTAALTGANAQLTAGGQEQQTQQAGLSALYNQFLQQQGHPYQQAQFLANIAEGTGALSGSSTTSTQPTSFFSDERLKEDIEKIGKTFDGQNIIKFRYRGDPRMRIGLSAQEVERHHPEAVGESHGYRTVDYDAATEDAAERGHFQRGGMALGGGANDNVTKALEMLRSYGMEGSAGPYGITPRPRAQKQELMTPKLPAPQKSEFQEDLKALHSGAGAVEDVKKLKSAAGELYDWAKPGKSATGTPSATPQKPTTPPAATATPPAATATSPAATTTPPAATTTPPAALGTPEDTSTWPVPPIPPEFPGMRRGGGVKGYAIGGTPYGDEGYIPEPIEPPRSLPVAQPPSSSGGGGSSDLASIASLAKIAAMFLKVKDGGAVERRHRTPGGGVGSEGVDSGTWDLPERPSRGVDAVLSSLRENQPAARSLGDILAATKNPETSPPKPAQQQGTANNAEAVYQGFRTRGYDDATARGFAANAVQESGARHDPPVGDGGRSRGLFQINGPRLDAYRKRYGRDPEQGSLDEALDFAHFELQGSEGKALAAINAAGNTPGDKAKAISTYFLRPKDTATEETRRAAIANQNGVVGDSNLREAIANQNGVVGDSNLDKFLRAIGLGGGDAATPRTAAAAAGEKSSPNWVERNQDWLVPVLSGLGGMAASPSRFLASAVLQGLGAGAQSYENVQNQVVQRARLGEETAAIPKRVAVSERTVATAETEKLLKVWEVLRDRASAFVFAGKSPPAELLAQQDALWRKLADLGITPATGAPSAAGTTPPAAGTTPPAASTTPPAAGTTPPAAGTTPITVDSLLDRPENKSRLRPDSNPTVLRKRAEEAAALGNLSVAKDLMGQAEKLTEKIEKTGVATDTNDKPFIVDGYSDLEAQKSNIASNPKWFDDAADTARERAATRQSLDSIREILVNFEPGALAEPKAKLAAIVRSLGGPELKTATMDATGFQAAMKDVFNFMFDKLKIIGGRAPAAELTGLRRAMASPDLTPEANRKILSQATAILDYEDAYYRGAVAAREQSGGSMDRAKFETTWSAIPENSMDRFRAKAYAETPVRGATPVTRAEWAAAKPGTQFIVEKGTIPGAKTHKRVRLVGIDKASGLPLIEDVD